MYAILAVLLYLTTRKLPFNTCTEEDARNYKMTATVETLCENA